MFLLHFWLICGLWFGVANSLFVWIRLQKHVNNGVFSKEETTNFSLALALFVLVPMVIFWGLQLSANMAPSPNFLTWPDPQKQVAIAFQVVLWIAMVYWVFFKAGAQTLSTYIGVGQEGWKHKYFFSAGAFKLMTLGTVANGVIAAFFTLPA